MKLRLVAAAAAIVTLAACGGGDDDGGGGRQGDVADLYIETMNDLAEELDVELDVDEDCVREVTGRLSDDDAAALMEAGLEGEPDVSAEADEIGAQLETCLTEG